MIEFQTWRLTTPDLGFVAYCYIAYLFDLPHPILLKSDVPPPQPSLSVLYLYGIIRPHQPLFILLYRFKKKLYMQLFYKSCHDIIEDFRIIRIPHLIWHCLKLTVPLFNYMEILMRLWLSFLLITELK